MRFPKRAHWTIACLVHKAFGFDRRAGPNHRDTVKLTVREIAVHADGYVVVKTWQASRKLLRSRIACARSINSWIKPEGLPYMCPSCSTYRANGLKADDAAVQGRSQSASRGHRDARREEAACSGP